METGERSVLIDEGDFARYVPSGHLVYGRAGTLLAVPFDPARLEVTGDPVPVVEGIAQPGALLPGAGFSISDSGSLVYAPEAGALELVWVDREGSATAISDEPGNFFTPRISSDGQYLALTRGGSTRGDIWIYDIRRDNFSRLTTEGRNQSPVWSPDGLWVAFASDRSGDWDLYRKRADFSGPAERILAKEHRQVPDSWSPDGKEIVFRELRPSSADSNNYDTWLLPLEGDGEPRPLLQSPFREIFAELSPDGRWMAYTSTESGRGEVYVQPFPGLGRRWPVSTDGGWGPAWSPDGRELYYVDSQNTERIMAVDVTTEPEFTVGTPRLLFEGPHVLQGRRDFDVTPDGRRFVMLRRAEESGASQQLNVVLNWFQELERLDPTSQ